MKRIIVTGGAGFIGAHLCRALLSRGDSVICVDNLYSGTEENVAEFASSKNFRFKCHDVIVPIDLNVDEIYHLACPASPPFYQADPIRTLKTNVIGTLNMLELAKRVGAKILLASTSETYGDPEEHPQTETYWGNVNPIGIRSCYDEGKRCAETLTMDFHRQYSVDVRIARIFNTYGPGMRLDDGRVVTNFIGNALMGKPLTIYGNGTQTRSFCYVSDLIPGLINLMEYREFPGPVNLGNPAEIMICELAGRILALAGRASEGVEFLPLPGDDPTRRKPDISKAKRILGWAPKVNLADGLRAVFEYFREKGKI